MKKLMIAAAIVCAAAMSHAAACSWQISSIGKTPSDALPSSAISYFMEASTYETFSGLSGNQVAAYCEANKLYSSTTLNSGRGSVTAAGSGGTYAEGAELSGYVVVFDNSTAADADYYLYSGTATKTAPGSGDMGFNFAYNTGTTAWQATAVPEPTSGLLLLLGVAGLALRRRRA